jgi:4-diphosphocytidyl-2C-methyl-D-erythritol kinase
MESTKETIRVKTIKQYQSLIDRVRETKQPVKISLAKNIPYYAGVNASGVIIELGLNYDVIKPDI